MDTSKLLADVLTKYAVPDPKIVSKLPKGGMQLDFVGHADITRILIEIDPLWSWEPVAYNDNGLPAFDIINGMAHMAGRLTVHGKTLIGVGSCLHNKPDLFKELISDFLRNAAMRFGISLSLWTKNEWEDLGPAIPVAKSAPKKASSLPVRKPVTDEPEPTVIKPAGTLPVDLDVITKFVHVCAQTNIDHDQVADLAGVDLSSVSEADMDKLRTAYKTLKEGKK